MKALCQQPFGRLCNEIVLFSVGSEDNTRTDPSPDFSASKCRKVVPPRLALLVWTSLRLFKTTFRGDRRRDLRKLDVENLRSVVEILPGQVTGGYGFVTRRARVIGRLLAGSAAETASPLGVACNSLRSTSSDCSYGSSRAKI